MKKAITCLSLIASGMLLGFELVSWTSIRTSAQRGQPSVPITCTAPLEPYLRVDLYMDRSIDGWNKNPDGTWPTVEWEKFVAEVLAKQLPGGTINLNTGWWRRPNGTVFNGLGRNLSVHAPAKDAQAHRAAVKNIINEYKKRTGTQSVGWEEDWVCVVM